MDGSMLEEIATKLTGAPRTRLTQNERYVAGNHRPAYVPKEATAEYRALARKATVNFVGLVLRSLLQDLSITGYRHEDMGLGARVWDGWVKAGMQSGKANLAIRHAAVEGESYSALMPTPRTRTWTACVFSKHEVYAHYVDPVNDPRPHIFAARIPGEPDLAGVWMEKNVGLLDMRSRTMVGFSSTAQQFFGDTEPVVRYTAGDWIVSAKGIMEPVGEIEPLLAAQDRVNQAVMDLLLVQTFGAVTLRYIAGLSLPSDDDEAKAKKLVMAVDRLLTAEDPETKFGSLVGTPLEPFIRNVDAAIRHLAIISQTPPNRLLGELENIGADAILVARESQESKLKNYRETVGERFEQFARAIAVSNGQGDPGPAGYLTWRSTELRTIAEVFDAVVKGNAAGLNVEPLLRRNLDWRPEEFAELMEGYQEQRNALSSDVAAIMGTVDRQRTALAPVPASAGSADGAPSGALA